MDYSHIILINPYLQFSIRNIFHQEILRRKKPKQTKKKEIPISCNEIGAGRKITFDLSSPLGQKESKKGLVMIEVERLMGMGKARDDRRKFRIPQFCYPGTRKYTLCWPGDQLLCNISDNLK